MSKAKHTPTPWKVGGSITGPRAAASVWLTYDYESGDGHRYGTTNVTKGDRLVAIVPHGEGDAAADAALIVTAVNAHADLLALAERIAALNENAGVNGAGMLNQLVADARAIIAKATT